MSSERSDPFCRRTHTRSTRWPYSKSAVASGWITLVYWSCADLSTALMSAAYSSITSSEAERFSACARICCVMFYRLIILLRFADNNFWFSSAYANLLRRSVSMNSFNSPTANGRTSKWCITSSAISLRRYANISRKTATNHRQSAHQQPKIRKYNSLNRACVPFKSRCSKRF